MKILHVFYSSLPSTKGGDIRSRDIIESQHMVGLDVLAVTSPFQRPENPGVVSELINDINYERTYNERESFIISEDNSGITLKLRKFFKIIEFARRILKISKREHPDVIHAHSTFFCGMAARMASFSLGVPVIYEVRSLWEQRSVMKSPTLLNKLFAVAIRVFENCAMRLADHVVVINEGLKQECISRGIKSEKITIVCNGVNLSRVSSQAPSYIDKKPSELVVGYIGSISEIEGLDLLVEAVNNLRKKQWNNEVHFFGDGPFRLKLEKLILGIPGVFVHGPFESKDVAAVYSKVDIIVNPRRKSKLTDSVTPLKPLEAMAWRKPVVVSSALGMLELVTHEQNGLVFEAGNSRSLEKTLEHLTTNIDALYPMVERARVYVDSNRNWYELAEIYKDLYYGVVNKRMN